MKLILVYNAKSDPFSQVADYLHKFLQPSTYQCDLCSLTHNNFGKKSQWKTFLKDANLSVDYLYKDNLPEKLKQLNISNFPAILIEENNSKTSVFLDSEKISRIKSIDDLELAIKDKIDNND